MSSLYSKKYADKYETNKYIWENESDKNSEAARKATSENAEIRKQLGISADTMNYDEFKNARANHSDYYDMAKNVTINPEYKKQSDTLYDNINNFTYDAENDPNYIAYSNAARRESASAQKGTYAMMTKASGGRNNSFASAATAQVGQTYAQKVNNYAKTLADEAYKKLVEKYQLSNDRYKTEIDRAQKEYDNYMKLGDVEVETKRNIIKDQMDSKQAQLDYKNSLVDYDRNKIGYENDKVDLERDKVGYENDKVDLDRNKVGYENDKVDLDRNKIGYKNDQVDYDRNLVGYQSDLVRLDRDKLGYETDKVEHSAKLNNYQSQLIKNKILNEKNQYEYERWLKDPNYEIKDKKLSEAIGDYMAYSWLKENGKDYLYSKFYK